jgi:presenilin-like A22 family membrane protease
MVSLLIINLNLIYNTNRELMIRKLKNYAGAIASMLFLFMNASSFGHEKHPFFLFGMIIGLISTIIFFNLNEETK